MRDRGQTIAVSKAIAKTTLVRVPQRFLPVAYLAIAEINLQIAEIEYQKAKKDLEEMRKKYEHHPEN